MGHIDQYVGSRVLATIKENSRYSSSIEEYRILEVSPSGNYVRLCNTNGKKFWMMITDVAIVECLRLPEAHPNKEKCT